MPLKNYRPKIDTILAGEETVALRGLNVKDISILLDGHRTLIEQMISTMDGMEKGFDLSAKVDRLIIESIHAAPDLVAGIISLAADEPDAGENAKSLPFATQVDALVKVFNLTFQEVGGLGNFLAVLQRAMSATRSALAAPPPPPRH